MSATDLTLQVQVQLLLQIIINRICLLWPNVTQQRQLKYSVAAISKPVPRFPPSISLIQTSLQQSPQSTSLCTASGSPRVFKSTIVMSPSTFGGIGWVRSSERLSSHFIADPHLCSQRNAYTSLSSAPGSGSDAEHKEADLETPQCLLELAFHSNGYACYPHRYPDQL